MKKERLTMSDEQQERMLIAEQIERAATVASDASKTDSSTTTPEEGLKRSEGVEKVVLSLSAKDPPSSTDIPPVGGIVPLKMNPLKLASTNPLKRANVFKSSALTSATLCAPVNNGGKKRTMSAAESLMYEEQERKRRKMERDGGGV